MIQLPNLIHLYPYHVLLSPLCHSIASQHRLISSIKHWRHASWHTDLVQFLSRQLRVILTLIIHRHPIHTPTLIHIPIHPSCRFRCPFPSDILEAQDGMAVTRVVHTVHSLEAAIRAVHMAEDPGALVDLAEVSTAIVSSNGKIAMQELLPAAPVFVQLSFKTSNDVLLSNSILPAQYSISFIIFRLRLDTSSKSVNVSDT